MSKVASQVPKTRKAVAKKQEVEEVPKVEAPVPVAEHVVEPVAEQQVREEPQPQVEVSLSDTVRERLAHLVSSTTSELDSLKQRLVEYKKLLKDYDAVMKQRTKKQKRVKEPRDYSKPITPTGFAVPKIVSKELYHFLVETKATMKDVSFVPRSKEDEDNWPRIPVKAGHPVARTDVVSHLHNYIRTNNLSENDVLKPDAKLKKILPQLEAYSKKAINGYISSHFPTVAKST